MDQQKIIERVKRLYPDALVDLDGADYSFEMIVISAAFEGLNTLKRQQPILALFKDELATGTLHVLTVKARTPMEQSGSAGLVQILGN